MFCHYCGAPNPDDAAFCRGCGRERAHPEAAPTAPRVASVPPQPEPEAPPPADLPPPEGQAAPSAAAPDAVPSQPPSGLSLFFVAVAGLMIITALGYALANVVEGRREAAQRDADSARALDTSLKNAATSFHVAGTTQPVAPTGSQPAVTSTAIGPIDNLQALASLAFPPDGDDANALACDRLADHPDDPLRVGDGVQVPLLDIAQALPVCERAAAITPDKPRYHFLYGRVLDAAGRSQEAIQQYTLAERAGYVLADLNLGLLYGYGDGVAQNQDLAIAFLQRAHLGGLANARAFIGDLYAHASPPDYAQAKAFYEQAIDVNAPQGYAGLAVLYDLGLGVDKDRVKGAELARKAAELGNVNGMFWLGRHLRDGQGVERNPSAACGWFDKTARANYAYGQLEAGRCFYTGDGGIRNHEYAFYWLIRAAQAGLPEAQELVGDMYDDGDGVAADEAQAVAWYRKAAVQGDTYGMMQLGVHLRQGKGVAWSEAEAMQWFEKAARAGYAAAQSSLGAGYLAGLGQDAGQGHQDYQQAAYWFGEAIKQGEGFALVNLGIMYENGLGVPQDLDRAKQLYTQAAQSSNPAAARVGQEYAANLASPPSTSEPQPGSLARTKQSPSNADAWVAIVVGAVAVAAVTTLFGHSSTTSSDASADASTDTSSIDTAPFTPFTPSIDWGSSSSSSTPDPAPLHPYYPYQQWKTPNGDLTNPNIAWR
jgi:TPR repeat protein